MIADRLDRYIARNVLGAILVVQVVLLGLDLVITYINDLGDVEGDYGALQVLFYLVMRLPWRFYQYAPVGVLIGALIGLGGMASSNELTVMRAAGRSLGRILWGVMKPVILVIVVVLFIAEFVSLGPNSSPAPGGSSGCRGKGPCSPSGVAGNGRATASTVSAPSAPTMSCST